MANCFNVGYVEVTEAFTNGEFSVTVRDSRIGVTKRKPGMSLPEYDQLLDSLYADPSVKWIKRLDAAPAEVSRG